MHYSRTIRQILAATLVSLTLVGLSAAYWALAGQDSLLLREDNPRIIEAQRDILRGGIYDRDARPLAETVERDSVLARRYLQPSTYSIVGYYSLRYGVGGAESAYDTTLAGSRPIASIADFFNRRILNKPQIGSNIMLTLDLEMQDPLVRSMCGAAGAAIVLDARTGALLALISQPSFDPNKLDEQWSALIEAEGQPFFNRALQGNYQLGGNMYLVWLAQAIDSGFDLSWRFTGAADPVDLGDGMTAACVIRQDAAELTLDEALAYGCPAAFASYRLTKSAVDYAELIAPYLFQEPFTLAGFPQPETIVPAVEIESLSPDILLLRDALGQGDLTTSPLHLATLIAAIANDGLAVEPAPLSGLRPPDSDQWQPQPLGSASRRLMDIGTAQGLQAALRAAATKLWPARQDSPSLAAYIARSYSGAQTQLWLNGFVETDNNGAMAFVVLLEDTDDVNQLISIGSELFDLFTSAR